MALKPQEPFLKKIAEKNGLYFLAVAVGISLIASITELYLPNPNPITGGIMFCSIALLAVVLVARTKYRKIVNNNKP